MKKILETFRQKWADYLLEIFVITIGILGAFTLNNWNENRKVIKSESDLITSLKKEIANNIVELDNSVKKNNLYLKTGENIILRLTQNEATFNANEISLAFNYTSYKVDSPVLDRIIATNSNVLIEKNEYLEYLVLLKSSYTGIAKSEFYLDEFWNNHVSNFIISCGVWYDEEETNYQITIKELLLGGYSKRQFITILSMQKDLHKYWKDRKIIAIQKSEEILKILNE